MLVQRLAVAAAGLPLLGLMLALPEPVFAGVLEVILAVAVIEMLRALAPDRPWSVALSAAAATTLFVALARTTDGFPLASFVALLVVALAIMLRPNARLARSLGGWWITGCLYVGVLGAHLVLIRLEPEGREALILLLAAVFATDTGAYAAGRLFGRHLLAPRISPKKTWEGGLGGLVLGAAGGVVAALVLDLDAGEPWGAPAPLFYLALPLAAIAGDLLESGIKRQMGVKDMSGLLPGHGGLLDRLDSILVAGACLYWMVRWFPS